ncbi:hypothetical protein IQ243_26200 [Nostocales cyanobacterium LEGE 11386]|nr:hypothetical protein [Nostocales cyanobacterium LEGE 11386]
MQEFKSDRLKLAMTIQAIASHFLPIAFSPDIAKIRLTSLRRQALFV